ncbi:MAG: pyridoxamine 5'-phosphate oxidase family protein [Alphaproteobacteria bacterium]|nr:pyridoxamine 5'-phosphate oxidase family protein [Alphaproteobacteria bacterium]
MESGIRALILDIIARHRVMTLATLRPDGWPQATTVGYASDGMILYFLCGAGSQKASNLAACNKVSLTIDGDPDQVMELKGVSMAATAEFVKDPALASRLYTKLIAKYPGAETLPPPDPAMVRYVRLTPKVISVLDYSKGFGHTDLVDVTADDLRH